MKEKMEGPAYMLCYSMVRIRWGSFLTLSFHKEVRDSVFLTVATRKHYPPREQRDEQNFDLKSSIYWTLREGLKGKQKSIQFHE